MSPCRIISMVIRSLALSRQYSPYWAAEGNVSTCAHAAIGVGESQFKN